MTKLKCVSIETENAICTLQLLGTETPSIESLSNLFRAVLGGFSYPDSVIESHLGEWEVEDD